MINLIIQVVVQIVLEFIHLWPSQYFLCLEFKNSNYRKQDDDFSIPLMESNQWFSPIAISRGIKSIIRSLVNCNISSPHKIWKLPWPLIRFQTSSETQRPVGSNQLWKSVLLNNWFCCIYLWKKLRRSLSDWEINCLAAAYALYYCFAICIIWQRRCMRERTEKSSIQF